MNVSGLGPNGPYRDCAYDYLALRIQTSHHWICRDDCSLVELRIFQIDDFACFKIAVSVKQSWVNDVLQLILELTEESLAEAARFINRVYLILLHEFANFCTSPCWITKLCWGLFWQARIIFVILFWAFKENIHYHIVLPPTASVVHFSHRFREGAEDPLDDHGNLMQMMEQLSVICRWNLDIFFSRKYQS